MNIIIIIIIHFILFRGAVCLARILLTNHRWKNSTVPDIFAELVARHPTKAAILYEEQVWVYRDLDNYSNQVGNFFQYIGVKPGNTIAVFMTNCPEYIGIVLGIGKIGAKSALINFNLRGEPLIHSLKICNPSAIIFDATLGEAMQNIHDQLSSDLQRACFAVNGKPSVYTSRLFDDEVKAMSSNPPPHDNVATSDSKIKINLMIIHMAVYIRLVLLYIYIWDNWATKSSSYTSSKVR